MSTPPRRSTVVLLTLALLAALGASGYLWLRWETARDDARADHDLAVRLSAERAAEQDALAAGRTLLVDMTSYGFRTVTEDFTWLERISDEQLRTRMEENVAALTRIITDSRARAEGTVIDAAARVVDTEQVEVVAFVDQIIRDRGEDGYKLEEQRVSMTLVLRDGEWLMDRLDLQSGATTG